ncbi:TIM barrel protein [Ensifer sp. ENS05]|uniref:sugar phosphate isomerase/epimerase family protein n=1 Tax=Ensifer sp. ENS05 TaxID=2769277 RepID=UPI00178527CD|nr:TIM barrel protein [Ensifer sp. ENS05]MBD9596881.1 TIM barrel protein [Ensifer sp. ENS05]
MRRELKIGVSGLGVLHTDKHVPSIDDKFLMVKESGAFDYLERTPTRNELDAFLKASQKHGVPISSGGFFYMVGRDEALLSDNLKIAKECGSQAHNVQIFTNDANGRPLSNEEIADVFLRTSEEGDRVGVKVCFENHINMWSEHPGRVMEVAQLVERRGVQYSMTMDHSHVIFKIDNQPELEVQDLKRDVDEGKVVLDPFKHGAVTQKWIEANIIVIAHLRPVVPNNPINIWSKHPDGSYGRGVQYPWLRPSLGEWHSEWDGERLNPWKKVVRDLLTHHATSTTSRLSYVTLEMIPPPDYGAGAKYSIFDHNVACARWVRSAWDEIVSG